MPEIESQQKYLRLLDWITKFGTALLVVTYLVGFLIVSHHLTKYGVSTLGVLHLKYLVTGAWAIVPIVAVVMFVRAAESSTDDPNSISGPVRFHHGVVRMAIGLAIPCLFGCIVIISYEGALFSLTWKQGLGFAALFCSGGYFGYLLWRCISGDKVHRWYFNPDAVPFYVMALLTIFLLYVQSYARYIYPLIPYAFGGGKPLSVCFIEGQKPLPYTLVTDGQSHRTIPYQLLETSDKSYYVVSPNAKEQSIEVSRDSVSGMVVLK